MPKYIETQSNKIISSYGGVGSIIETVNGAVIVEPFDKWFFFVNKKHEDQLHHIHDNRLLNRLKFEKGFPFLKHFVKIPSNTANFKNKSIPQSRVDVISARYFPEWFFCPKCNKFHNIHEWWHKWKYIAQLLKIPTDVYRRRFYDKPKCYSCLKDSNGKLFVELEQVRFIMTAPDGTVSDIPWKRWNTVSKSNKDINSPSGKLLLDSKDCCENQDLRYIRSRRYSDLSGIKVECKNCGKYQTLSGLFNLRLPVNDKQTKTTRVFKKPVIRSSNSVYYPIIINSLFLPTGLALRKDDSEEIDKWLAKGKSADFIIEIFSVRGYSKECIENYLEEKESLKFEPEIQYRLKEFNFLLKSVSSVDDRSDDSNNSLIFLKQKLSTLREYGIEDLIIIKRLKMTSVQTAYTRQEPLDKDQFLKGEFEKVKPRYTSNWGNSTEFLPATENYGEGFFINFEKHSVAEWCNYTINHSIAKKRLGIIHQNALANSITQRDRFLDLAFLTKFIMIHTLSHILIKELEFSVGYPATSIRERLYIDNNQMSGILIYTIAGSEGSYGGLIAQAEKNRFEKILATALDRARDCASDPICYNAVDGQGIGGLNLAACYSCAIIPDISCEEFNCFLDRGLLIDDDFGYFSHHP